MSFNKFSKTSKTVLCLCKVNRLHSNKAIAFNHLLSSPRYYSASVDSLLSKVDKHLKHCRHSRLDVNIPSVVEQLHGIDPKWPGVVEERIVFASVVHGLHQSGYHNDVNKLVDVLLKEKYDIHHGLSTTILKCYLEQKLWDKALPWFEEMKLQNQLRHTRVYNNLISSLAENDLLQIAYRYFKEVDATESVQNGFRTGTKSIDHKTVLHLLESTLRYSQGSVVDRSGDHMKSLDVTTTTIVHNVVNYLGKWAEPVPRNIVNIIGTLLQLEKTHTVSLTQEHKQRCIKCNTDLRGNPDFSPLCDNIIINVRDQMLQLGLHKDLAYLDSLFDKVEYFDIVIDAANLFNRAMKRSKTSPERLNRLLANLNKSPDKKKRVALVFHKQKQEANLKSIQMQSNVHTITLRRIDDDLILLYVAAKSEQIMLKKGATPVVILSNDSFRNHRVVAGGEEDSFLNWLNFRQRGVDLDGEMIAGSRQLQPVVREDKDNFHLVSRDGIVCCCLRTEDIED